MLIIKVDRLLLRYNWNSFFVEHLNALPMSAPLNQQLLETLIPCEWRVLLLLADDQQTVEIAETMFLSKRSVETYRDRISSKLEISGSGSLSRFARRNREKLITINNKIYPPHNLKIIQLVMVKSYKL